MVLIVYSNLVSMPSLFSWHAKTNAQQGISVHYVLMESNMMYFEYGVVFTTTFIPTVYDFIMPNG